MKTLLLFIILILLFSSCATIFNRPHTTIHIMTTRGGTLVINEDTVGKIQREFSVPVERSNRDLQIKIFNDSSFVDTVVKPTLSLAYVLDFYPLMGLGVPFDAKSPKKYTYPDYVYMDAASKKGRYMKYNPERRKGKWRLDVSVPYANNFWIKPAGESDSKLNTGFWGISAGVGYYYQKTQYVHLSAGGATDFPIPVLGPLRREGEYQSMSTTYVNLTNNHDIGRFSLGYGLSYAVNNWSWVHSGPVPDPIHEHITVKSHSLGLAFPVYYQPKRSFFFGILYRPTFYRFQKETPFMYEHFLTFKFGWRILLNP